MADFCAPCTVATFGPGLRNDFDNDGDQLMVNLCEGCGWHIFAATGVPLCGHDGNAGGPPEPFAFPDLCAVCIAANEDAQAAHSDSADLAVTAPCSPEES